MLVEVRTKKTQPASDTRSCCSDRLSRTRKAAARQANQLESATHVDHYTEALRDDDQKVTFDIESGRDGRESAANLVLA